MILTAGVPEVRRAAAAPTAPHIYLSAGEPSGDEYAAGLAVELRRQCPRATLTGMGGPRMANAGVPLTHDMARLTAMGLVEVVSKLPAHLRALRTMRRDVARVRPDVAVLVDYPGYHLKVAREFTRRGIPVLQFVAPKLWAWGAWRARGYRRAWTHCAVIFPFEPEWFERHGIHTTFVGHPVMDRVVPSVDEARRALGVPRGQRVLAVFPGSRPQEIRTMWQPFRDAAVRVQRALPDVHVLVAANVPSESLGPRMRVVPDRPEWVMAAAQVALGKSGTSNLLAVRCRVPLVVAYRMHPVTFRVASRVVQTRHVSPVNILADDPVIPEFLQHDMTPEALAGAMVRLFDDREAREAQFAQFRDVDRILRPQNTAAQVARMALHMTIESGE